MKVTHQDTRLQKSVGVLFTLCNEVQVHDSISFMQVSIERTLGTVIGGVLGYFAVIINRSITLTDDVIFGPLSAAAVAVIGVVVGRALKLEYSSRLFCMTYILVLMGAEVASGMLPDLSRLIESSGLDIIWLLAGLQPTALGLTFDMPSSNVNS